MIPPAEACRVTVCAVATEVALAVNVADVALAGTTKEAGTLTDVLLLATLTANPVLGAGAFSLTVQVSLLVPVKVVFAHTKLLSVVVTAAFSCRAMLLVTPPAEACRVTVCAVVTAEALAVNVAEDALAGTTTEAGTFTDALLLARLTANPVLGAGPFKPTVQVSLVVPVKLVLAHVKLLSAVVTVGETPAPLNAISVLAPVEELLAMDTWPVTEPVTVGSNWMFRVAV
ncbi:MAG: hypothetical protein WCA37_15035 [Terracidiphilus sp.]